MAFGQVTKSTTGIFLIKTKKCLQIFLVHTDQMRRRNLTIVHILKQIKRYFFTYLLFLSKNFISFCSLFFKSSVSQVKVSKTHQFFILIVEPKGTWHLFWLDFSKTARVSFKNSIDTLAWTWSLEGFEFLTPFWRDFSETSWESLGRNLWPHLLKNWNWICLILKLNHPSAEYWNNSKRGA